MGGNLERWIGIWGDVWKFGGLDEGLGVWMGVWEVGGGFGMLDGGLKGWMGVWGSERERVS